MQSFEGFRKSGTFFVSPEIEVQGELILKGDGTTLDLYSKDFFSTHDLKDGCITGTFYDRTKVSLIHCITTQGPGSGTRGKEKYHFSSVFPHFALFGDEHITSEDRKISEVSFLVDDAATLFYDFDAFGQVINALPHMERIVETKEIERDIAIGKHPMIFYFTGKHEVFTAETALGTISAEHRPSYSMPGPHGIKLDNEIHVNVAFKEALNVGEAITKVDAVLRFLEIIAGRPQNVLRLAFRLQSTDERPSLLNVYWCMPPNREGGKEDRRPHPGDLPIQAARTPDYFAAVLKRWLARHHEWTSARFRFSSSFACQHRFTIDRIVGAANMFDILPSSAVPATVVLPQDVKDAKKVCSEIFKKLPKSPERESVLNALGRLGKSSLRRKIQSRAKLILDVIPERFPELDLVIQEAVDCRNYFVHGSKAKIDYGKDFDLVSFYTEALEFIFAASDLLECGWDIKEWSTQSSTVAHPFDRFRHGYAPGLAELKKALAVAAGAKRPAAAPATSS